MHSHKFLYMKHCWSNKGHMGMKSLRSEVCILLKHHADQWKLSHFKFSITSQIHRPFLWLLLDLKLPNMGRKIWKTNSVTYPFYLFVGKFPKLFNFSLKLQRYIFLGHDTYLDTSAMIRYTIRIVVPRNNGHKLQFLLQGSLPLGYLKVLQIQNLSTPLI